MLGTLTWLELPADRPSFYSSKALLGAVWHYEADIRCRVLAYLFTKHKSYCVEVAKWP